MTGDIERLLGDFDDYAAEEMRRWPGPGLAVGILYKNEILHKCYGVRDVQSQAAVDADTLFSIGSCTKAFTTMALALLVQDGLLAWDTPIRCYIPDFELSDRVASEQMTLRDLASHRSGLPRHDLMWYGSAASRQELYQRLRYLQPSQPFRYTFQYQNLMYMVAGYLIEQVTGLTWETFVETRILRPLNLTRTVADMAAITQFTNRALPHAGDAETIHPIPYYTLDAVAPAGAVYSCLNDMSRWLLLHMQNGISDGAAFINPDILKEMHSAQIIMPPVPEMVWRDYPEISLNTSGMGWAGLVYRGHPVVRHMGSIDGFVAQVSFIPAEELGVIVFSNMNGNLLPVVLTFEIFDRLLGFPPAAWSERLLAYQADVQAKAAALRDTHTRSRQADRPPSHPLPDYAGDYEHPAYGLIRIECDGDRLSATRDRLKFTLSHYHYDTFDLLREGTELPLPATFHLKPDGDIHELHIPFEPVVAPIVFTRYPSG